MRELSLAERSESEIEVVKVGPDVFCRIFMIKYPLFPRRRIGAFKKRFFQVSFTIDLRKCRANDGILH